MKGSRENSYYVIERQLINFPLYTGHFKCLSSICNTLCPPKTVCAFVSVNTCVSPVSFRVYLTVISYVLLHIHLTDWLTNWSASQQDPTTQCLLAV